MTRLYGRALNGERALDYTSDVRFERTTILSSVRANGDMVIMDNLSSHRVAGVIDPILAADAKVLYLPLYSPDLNTIEMLW